MKFIVTQTDLSALTDPDPHFSHEEYQAAPNRLFTLAIAGYARRHQRHDYSQIRQEPETLCRAMREYYQEQASEERYNEPASYTLEDLADAAQD